MLGVHKAMETTSYRPRLTAGRSMSEDSMTRPIQILFSIVLAGLSAGCATPGYWTDRARDGADILTVTVGSGFGAKVQVGPIRTGLLLNSDLYGLRGGAFGNQSGDPGPHFSPTSQEIYIIVGLQDVYRSKISAVAQRNKDFSRGLVPHTPDESPASRTQLSVVIGALVSVRAGFNPGELLDFLLGWANIDIYDDDLKQTRLDRALEQKRKESPYITLEERRRLRDTRLKQGASNNTSEHIP